MMETCWNPSASRAARIAPTRPSIISLGLTTSAPARAYWKIYIKKQVHWQKKALRSGIKAKFVNLKVILSCPSKILSEHWFFWHDNLPGHLRKNKYKAYSKSGCTLSVLLLPRLIFSEIAPFSMKFPGFPSINVKQLMYFVLGNYIAVDTSNWRWFTFWMLFRDSVPSLSTFA